MSKTFKPDPHATATTAGTGDIVLSDICEQLRLASSILEKSAYDLANAYESPDVAHLILSAETIERVIDRISKADGKC